MTKILTIVNTSWLLLVTVAVLVINDMSSRSYEEMIKAKEQVEIYLEQKPDTITINVNNYINTDNINKTNKKK